MNTSIESMQQELCANRADQALGQIEVQLPGATALFRRLKLNLSSTWQALYTGVAQLSDDLINHIHFENNVFFPQFRQMNVTTNDCGCSV